jgi:hypothetical protein
MVDKEEENGHTMTNETRSPSQSPWVVVTTPTLPNIHQAQTLSLNNFEVSIEATLDELPYAEGVAIHAIRVDLRKTTQVYLKETLPFGNLVDLQLYSLGRRNRNLLDVAESFRYSGEAVFQDGAPEHDELLQAQQGALNDSETFQFYIQNVDSLKDVVLIEAVVLRDPVLATENLPETVSSTAVIVVASLVSLIVLLLNIAMICKLNRLRQHSLPTSTPVGTVK